MYIGLIVFDFDWRQKGTRMTKIGARSAQAQSEFELDLSIKP